jgi:hypothetical protein
LCLVLAALYPPLPALALDVKISQPPNPFIAYTSEQFVFVGIATDSAGKDVTADCDWTWYFTKGKGVSGNPVLYAFTKAGEVSVTAAAHLMDDSGAATITGTIATAPLATDAVNGPFMHLHRRERFTSYGAVVDCDCSICAARRAEP